MPVDTRDVPEYGRLIMPGAADAGILFSQESLSFWGGVDPETGLVIDRHHPLQGKCVAGKILAIPSSRGSCSGSGTILELLERDLAPAALIVAEHEDVLTLGSAVGMFLLEKAMPIIRLPRCQFDMLSDARWAVLADTTLKTDKGVFTLVSAVHSLSLSAADQEIVAGRRGAAASLAMKIISFMAIHQGAERLIDVANVHIDGCIYASKANLTFAKHFLALGAEVTVPTTTNAISVDYQNWRQQGVRTSFGEPAECLAEAYVQMGCSPTFTCAPYLGASVPRAGEMIAWAESNAVVYANTVLGARTNKHPDFLDLCIALTGRAPYSGIYLDENRIPQIVIQVEWPDSADDLAWPLLGYLAGVHSRNSIPLLKGLPEQYIDRDGLKALCAAFGTTSAAPMLHIENATPGLQNVRSDEAEVVRISKHDFARCWHQLNTAETSIDLVAIGSPHASFDELREIARLLGAGSVGKGVSMIITTSRTTIERARVAGVLQHLVAKGVQVISDICWCTIEEPVFPREAKSLITNSGKYAHYGPGLSGCNVRLGSMSDCVRAALSGEAPASAPAWTTS